MMNQPKSIWRAVLLVGLGVVAASAQTAPTSRQVTASLEQGYQLLKQNRRIEALAAFTKVIEREPSNHAALIEVGYLHAGLKHWRSAAKYLAAASAQDSENKRLHMDLGYAYQALRDFSKAESEFQAVAKEPGEFQMQAESALAVLQSVRQTPKDSKQARTLKEGYDALNQGNRTLARQRFESALSADPRNPAVLKQLGFLDLSQGKVQSATKRFEAVRSADPNDHFAALQLGYLYQRRRKTAQAQEAFNAALASSDPQIHGAAQAALVSTGEAGKSEQDPQPESGSGQ